MKKGLALVPPGAFLVRSQTRPPSLPTGLEDLSQQGTLLAGDWAGQGSLARSPRHLPSQQLGAFARPLTAAPHLRAPDTRALPTPPCPRTLCPLGEKADPRGPMTWLRLDKQVRMGQKSTCSPALETQAGGGSTPAPGQARESSKRDWQVEGQGAHGGISRSTRDAPRWLREGSVPR